MTVEAATALSAPPLGLVKMEDRKRASASDHHDDSAPPAKRQATNVNGPVAEPAADVVNFGTHGSSWTVELERYQKDALLRKLKEYKRENAQLESRLADLQKVQKLVHEHLFTNDVFMAKAYDITAIRKGYLELVGTQTGALTYSILSDWTKFKEYESERSEKLKSAVEELLAKPTLPIDPAKLQEFLNKTDAAIEEREKQLKLVNVEKEQLAELLENATDRYLKAERRLDRSKSVVVAMIDRQHQNQSQSSPADQVTPTVNGDTNAASPEVTVAAVQEAEAAKLEAIATAEQRKLQIERLEAESKGLVEEVTKLNSRLSSLTDDDYAKTELFKAAKAQHEDLIKRINHLEATHVQLREEAKKLQADRTAYRLQMEEESSTSIKESESDLAKAESNEQRLRAERDNYQSKCSILESSRSEHKVTIQKLQELLDARDSQIQDLEAEVHQLKTNFSDTHIDSEVNLDDLNTEELKAKAAGLQRERALLQQEIRHMETAFRKSQALAVKKVSEFQAYEDRIAQLQAEKAKADQKYFGAMKTQVARTAERDALSVQNKKTSSLIAAFKETIARLEEAQRGYEKQLAEHRDIIESYTYRIQTSDGQVSQAEFAAKQSSNHVLELQKSLAAKDATIQAVQQSQRKAEVEVEKLNVRLAETKKKVEEWRTKARANPTEEVDMLRHVAYCSSCNKNLKDTMIKTCGHVLCKECVSERIQSRSRKCPHCLKAFGSNDVQTVHIV